MASFRRQTLALKGKISSACGKIKQNVGLQQGYKHGNQPRSVQIDGSSIP